MLLRNGLIAKQPKRRTIGHPGKPVTQMLAANEVWAPISRGSSRPATAGTAIR